MYIKLIWVALVTFFILQSASGKRSKKKRIQIEAAESTPQPNVLTYSTFGFNDVGSYNGFVPSSPDYANYLTSSKQESSTRLYAPAFPSALDSTGLGSYYDPQPDIGSFSISSDGYQTNGQLYQPNSQNVFTSFNNGDNNNKNKDKEANDLYINVDSNNAPIYGAKISSKGKIKNFDNFNHTEYNVFESMAGAMNNDLKNHNNNYPNVASLSPSFDSNKYLMISSPTSQSSSLKFPKILDFTSVKNYYPSSVDVNFQESNQKPFNSDLYSNPINTNVNPYKSYDFKDEQLYRNKFNFNDEKVKDEKDKEKEAFIKEDESDIKINFKNNRNKYTNDPKKSKNPNKGYNYSTNYSSTSFRFDTDAPKRPFNSSIDEISPASSNLDFVDYQFPEKEFSGLKHIQDTKSPFDTESHSIISNSFNEKHKLPEEYLNSFKNLYSTTPSTTSLWGNIFKTTEYSSSKNHFKKPFYKDEISDEIIHIPKRYQNLKYGKFFDNKFSDFSLSNTYKPHKFNEDKEQYDWTKEDFNTRFKSEEDLLGLRNHDTSHPSYIPTYKPSYNDFAEEVDYKKLVQKWRQNYLKSRYRDSNREFETYASETKPIHVPLPKPYPIEVPRPVIVPVPQPYPVKVPIPKPIAVPVVREITVPIEKPVPYPVFKKVPYPIEKPVPVPVEKQVQVPVKKPYPVHIPQIRPVFHHTKPHDDNDLESDEDEYIPRPDSKRPTYKRQKNTRSRPRVPSKRPSRMTYQDRNRKRVPNRRPPLQHHNQRPRRPYSSETRAPQRYRDDFDEYDSDSEFENYCKRTGKCK
ncbi:uncharacterized protein DDB_G0292186-like [Melitaea cinxia]|uniref:uncharacterized protein DDB_G0292186-like n=1 Tax=Melitaea cinxia TaxID=113334 RepID=UPI001E2716E6|nr:uncharacterized protein DDB_G0292186-like [Melitaea cinxia]